MVTNHKCCNKREVKRGLWSKEEDEILRNYIDKNGTGSWSQVPQLAGLQRCGKSCRMRWINYLRPDLKKGDLSFTEISRLIELQSVFGNRWSVIVKHFPGRTDNEIKNLWNTTITNKILPHYKTAMSAIKPSANSPSPPTDAQMQQMFIPNPPMPLQGFAPSVPVTDPIMIYDANSAAMPLSLPPPIYVSHNFSTMSDLSTWHNLSHIPHTLMNQTQPQISMPNYNSQFGFNNYNTNFMVSPDPQVQTYPMQAHVVPNNNSLVGFGNHNTTSFLNANPQLQDFQNAIPQEHLALNDGPMFGFANPTPALDRNISFNNSNIMLEEPMGPYPISFDEMPFTFATQEQLVESLDGLTNSPHANNAGVHPNNIENDDSYMGLFESSAPTTVHVATSSTTTMPTSDLLPAVSSSLPPADVSGFAPLPCSSQFWETYSPQSWCFWS